MWAISAAGLPCGRAFCGMLLVWLLHPAHAFANTMNEEIDYLISSVGKGGCSFLRDGRRMSGRDARSHLNSKARRNAHIIDSTQEFIAKIASQSATSGRPYLIRCKGEDPQNAADWLTALLAQHRAQ